MESCPSCDGSFDSRRAMKIHHSTVHGESLKGEETECAWCGKSIQRPPRRVDTHCFCDEECHGLWQSENLVGEDNPNYSRREVSCINCGEKMMRPPSHISNKNFCSNECRNEHFVGPKHPTWIGGTSDYLDGWTTRRDEYRGEECEDCGMTNEDHIEKYEKQLDVHHIIPRRKFDDVSVADGEENLMSLCIPCHRKRDNT